MNVYIKGHRQYGIEGRNVQRLEPTCDGVVILQAMVSVQPLRTKLQAVDDLTGALERWRSSTSKLDAANHLLHFVRRVDSDFGSKCRRKGQRKDVRVSSSTCSPAVIVLC